MRWILSLFKNFGRRKHSLTKENDRLDGITSLIGYRFRDSDLLLKALKHRSFVYAQEESGIDSNERLEFLGDAVLDLLVAEYLFSNFEAKREGELTQMKSLVVSRLVLAKKAVAIDLGTFVLLSDEERAAGGAGQSSILCDTFEALIGAMFLDGGIRPCRRFVSDHVLDDFDDLIVREDFINFKSRLLEHTQSLGDGHPRYLVSAEDGPDHEKMFSVEVSVTGECVGSGQGRSKKEAQQMAAKDALRHLGAL
ncbi:MAG: ribonuclease III [Candidatus Latescibacterota bacterium]|nr:ribonuclease III [Candidatus Latescibacterota bacterium]